MPAPKDRKVRQERILKRWAEAERGTGRLKRLPWNEIYVLTNEQVLVGLTEPTIITCDDVDVYAIMTVKQYFSMRPPTQNPLKQPMMVGIKGKLFREVV